MKYFQINCSFVEILQKTAKFCALFSAYIDTHPPKKIAKYMFLWLDIVDNYFPCTMKHFPRVSLQY